MKTINGITVFEFEKVEAAVSFSERCIKPMLILLGDCPYYWVTTLAGAKALSSLGYELLSEVVHIRNSSTHNT